MRLHLLLLLLLLSIISNAYAEDINTIKDKLISVSNDEKDFKEFLEELDSKGIDLTDEEYIKETIILRANSYAIDLKNYPNIKGLSIAAEEYSKTHSKQELTFSQKLKNYTNLIIYVIIFIIIIIIFSLLIKYRHKFKKTLSPEEIRIKERIQLARAKGYTDEQILTQFLKQDYSEEYIKKLM